MNLGIVGHAKEKFTKTTEELAKRAIRDAITQHSASLVISGHSPMGGIDIWAEEIADEMDVPALIFAPTRHQWDGEGGFKERNLQIAVASDLVVVIVVADLPPLFTGMKFPRCYHCNGLRPKHVKSGACWTAIRAPAAEWVILSTPR